jgi:NodT family efflux transporter outer membrane factor (OMF) lipoprotein
VRRASLVALALVLFAAGCAPPHPRYVPPATPSVPEYRENADWKTAAPQDAVIRGTWWEMFGDPQLDALEARVVVSNQTLKALDAQFAQARALVRTSRSALFPQFATGPGASVSRPSGNRAVSSFHDVYGDYLVPVSASYEADVWGRLHDAVAATRAAAQASAADLESATLSIHAELAVDYLTLRGLDRDKDLLDRAVAAYTQALELTTNRFRAGLASASDVAQAETQLETTRAQATDVLAQRALFEHAIAVLVGAPASALSLDRQPREATIPNVPPGLPSQLLERRPDIAAAERRVASAAAQVDIATAAFYPVLTLSGTVGFESSTLGQLLAGASNFWALGPTLVANVFDGGRRQAGADQARAGLAQAAAGYQASVLVAFREVEDQLATLRVLEGEAAIEDRAVAAAERSLSLATSRYRGGIASYLEVIAAQNAALTNERTALGIRIRRLNASVLLLKALGGGWDRSLLPTLTDPAP